MHRGSSRRAPDFACLWAGLLGLAWHNRFVQDDAFISFRYARNLAEGHGLVWGPGECVEGYTNFLWTLCMAIPHRLGWEPIVFSYGLGLALFALTLALVWRLATRLLGSETQALAVVGLLGTHYSFSAYATGGLETPLFTLLGVLVTALGLEFTGNAGGAPRRLAWSLAGAALVMTRMDGVVLLIPTAVRAVRGDPRRGGWKHRVCGLLPLGVPFALLVGGWLAWKQVSYGSLLPNTFWAKAASGYIPFGIYFVTVFFVLYFLLPVLALAWAARWRLRPIAWDPRWNGVAAPVGLWVPYVALAGGDFMEFRMMVPILPFLMIVFVGLACRSVPGRLRRLTVFGCVVACSILIATGVVDPPSGIHSIRLLRSQVLSKRAGWIEIGQVLGDALDHDPEVLVATSAAGAIPYYSRLATVDVLGLNDSWVARHGHVAGHGSGHRRRAPLEYLVQRGVNLLIGHPWLEAPGTPPPLVYRQADLERSPLRVLFGNLHGLAGTAILEIPIHPGCNLLVVYLRPCPAVERAIRRHHWRCVPIEIPHESSLGAGFGTWMSPSSV